MLDSKIVDAINTDIDALNAKWCANEELDFSTCGSSVIILQFGRKIKIKRAFEAAGLLGMSWDAGVKGYTLNTRCGLFSNKLGFQSLNYAEAYTSCIIKHITPFLEQYGVGLFNHTWVD